MALVATVHISIAEEIKELVSAWTDKPVRAFKVVMSAKRPQLVLAEGSLLKDHGDLASDLETSKAFATAGEPCAIFVNAMGLDGADHNTWVVIHVLPDDVNVGVKTRFAAVKKAINDAFHTKKIGIFTVSSMAEATMDAFKDAGDKAVKSGEAKGAGGMLLGDIAAKRKD